MGNQNLTQLYKENYSKMVKQTFRKAKGDSNSKEMYAKITALAESSQITDFITPGESFIIPNDQAKEV